MARRSSPRQSTPPDVRARSMPGLGMPLTLTAPVEAIQLIPQHRRTRRTGQRRAPVQPEKPS